MAERRGVMTRRVLITGTPVLMGLSGGGLAVARAAGGDSVLLISDVGLRPESLAEDARIAAEVRRRYVERLRYLAEHRPKDHREVIDHELAIYSELLGIEHALGGPSGWFPT